MIKFKVCVRYDTILFVNKYMTPALLFCLQNFVFIAPCHKLNELRGM